MKLIKIESIENKTAYDISVRDTNCFFVNDVLVHNSNACFAFNDEDGLWVQSRENIITPQSDNAGCAFYVESHKEAFMGIINKVKERYSIDTSVYTICIYFEWAGKGIQKGVAISNIEKSAFIIGIKIAKLNDATFVNYWVDSSGFSDITNRIYNITDFKMYEIDVDFNTPQLSQNKIIEMTLEVEDECPVGKSFGFSGIGEGIVFSYISNSQLYIMKSKGEKHSAKSKVNTLKPVDDAKINKTIEVVNKICPAWRLEQMLEKQFDLINGGVIDIKKLGDYIKLVINDIIKEETDVLSEAGLEPKDISKYVSEIARKYFFTRKDQELGL